MNPFVLDWNWELHEFMIFNVVKDINKYRGNCACIH